MSGRLEAIALPGIPEVGTHANVAELIGAAAAEARVELADEDIVCISQKIVSKAEGRVRRLGAVDPSERARELAERLGKDPRLVELILGETARIVRDDRVLIVETHAGLVCANAGIDSSNVPADDAVTLLPVDADVSARAIRGELTRLVGSSPAVLIADSFGRPWRVGQTDVAIGCAGIAPLDDRRGTTDSHGRQLAATAIAVADQLAAAADLARAKDSGEPVVVIRGAGHLRTKADGPGAAALQRGRDDDLFR